ncbi:MAG: hypothetical protein LBD03_02395 [Methanobrevibacter sp.]|nr:hypothetical protein [Candidatus Methanovirga procula]
MPKINKIKYKCKLLDNDVANFTVFKKNNKYSCSIIYKDVEIQPKRSTNEVLDMDGGKQTFWILVN